MLQITLSLFKQYKDLVESINKYKDQLLIKSLLD